MGEAINISEYIDIFKKRKIVILITIIIFIIAGGVLQYRHDKSYIPTYSSTVSVKINVNKKTASEESSSSKKNSKSKTSDEEETSTINMASLESSALNQSISEKYYSLATSKRAMMNLIDKLSLNTTPEIMANRIIVTPEESLMEFIDITVIDTDPKLAQKIASTMPEVFNKEIETVIGLDCVEVLYDATEPMINAKPQDNTFRNFTIVGIALAIFIVLLLECLDNKIVTPDDAEKYWGLPVIGVVPFEKESAKGKKLKMTKNNNIIINKEQKEME